jgi:antitoxin HigA-1
LGDFPQGQTQSFPAQSRAGKKRRFANESAKELGVPTNRLTQIIRGKRGISGDTALRLGRWFGTGPNIWINLQKNYELRRAAFEIGDTLKKIPQQHGKVKTTGELHF